MTVKHLQNIQRQQMMQEMVRDPTVLNKFRAGFTECATEVSRYVNKIECDNAVKQRLISHLSGCVTSINQITSSATATALQAQAAFPGMAMPGRDGLQVHIPLGTASAAHMFATGQDGAMNLSTSTTDGNNNRRAAAGPESKLSTPPPSGSSQFTFQFPPSAHSPATPTTPSTPRGLSIAVSPSVFPGPASLSSGYNSFSFPSPRYQPYHRREQLGSVSPCSRSSLGSLSPNSEVSNDVDVEHDVKREREADGDGDVWRPW